MAQFGREALEMFKADKPDPISGPRFTTGEVIEGFTDEGEFVTGRITAIGETTYRIESPIRIYTIKMSQAKYPPPEEKPLEK